METSRSPARVGRRAALPRDRGAVVHRSFARQPGILALLLHPRALRALHHPGARTLSARVVFRAGAACRSPPLDRRAFPLPWARMDACSGNQLPAAAFPGSVVRGRFRVLFRVRLQARLLHPADISGAGPVDRDPSRLGEPALCAGTGRGRRLVRDRARCRVALGFGQSPESAGSPRDGSPARTVCGLPAMAHRWGHRAGRRGNRFRVAVRPARRRRGDARSRRPRLGANRIVRTRDACPGFFRVSCRPENPGRCETGRSFLRRGHLRSHPAVLPESNRNHGRLQGRACPVDRLGAPEIPAGRGRLRARLASRPGSIRNVQRERPRRIPQSASGSHADRRPRPAPSDREKAVNAVSLALILTGVLLNASAQLLLKAGTNAVGHFEFSAHNVLPVGMKLAFEPHIAGGLACYAVSLFVWVLGLSRVEVSIAYPMLSIGYILNAVAAWYLFGESLTAQKLIGIAFIVAG